MPINPDIVGLASGAYERAWDDRDVMLYALAVGAGPDDPSAPLALTAENVEGQPLTVLPTFPLTKYLDAGGIRHRYGTFAPESLVHAEQAIEIHAPLSPQMTTVANSEISNVLDKGSGALVETRTRVTCAETLTPLFTSVSSLFIRGEGGWGGPRGSRAGSPIPEREPDHQHTWNTREDQALVYRLTGDRNPIHCDPALAQRGGFPRPILHGLCTFGYAGRALVELLGGADPRRLTYLSARFSAPVFPGDELVTSVWSTGAEEVAFQVFGPRSLVLDQGTGRIRA